LPTAAHVVQLAAISRGDCEAESPFGVDDEYKRPRPSCKEHGALLLLHISNMAATLKTTIDWAVIWKPMTVLCMVSGCKADNYCKKKSQSHRASKQRIRDGFVYAPSCFVWQQLAKKLMIPLKDINGKMISFDIAKGVGCHGVIVSTPRERPQLPISVVPYRVSTRDTYYTLTVGLILVELARISVELAHRYCSPPSEQSSHVSEESKQATEKLSAQRIICLPNPHLLMGCTLATATASSTPVMRKGTSSLGTDTPSEREINRLTARSEEEFWLFEKMDDERRQKERYISRLMEDHEVPDWAYTKPGNPMDMRGKGFDYETADLTRKRRRKEVKYADTLNELQFMKAVEHGDQDLNNLQ
nr:probable ATP-dependent DNA helicase CHR12 [Tanacetum cinerariifolium]